MKKNIYISEYITIIFLLIIFILILFYFKSYNIEHFNKPRRTVPPEVSGGGSGEGGGGGSGGGGGGGGGSGGSGGGDKNPSKNMKACGDGGGGGGRGGGSGGGGGAPTPVVTPVAIPSEIIQKKPSPSGPLPSPVPPAVLPPEVIKSKGPTATSVMIKPHIPPGLLPLSQPLSVINPPTPTESIKGPVKNVSSSDKNNNVKLAALSNSVLNLYEKQIAKNTPLQESILKEIQIKQKELEDKKKLELNQAKKIQEKEKVLLTRSRMLQINQDRSSYRKKIIYSLLAIIFVIFIITIMIYIFFFKNVNFYTRQRKGKWIFENEIIDNIS